MTRIDPVVTAPELCTADELKDFCGLVSQGDEVATHGLEDRVRRAKSLVLLRVSGKVVGIAALKHPEKSYRDGVFNKAQVPGVAAAFDLELGWVFVSPDHRGKGYSNILSAAAMSKSDKEPVFATTRLDNVPMQQTLKRLSFRSLGDSWRSTRGQKPMLGLHVTR